MIAEAMRRRDDFDAAGAVWIELADHQAWGFPRPWLEIRARFKDGKAVAAVPAYSYGPAADEMLAAMAECDDDTARICLVATLAATILRLHYDLGDGELDGLLAFRRSDPGSMGWMVAVIDLATGLSGVRGT